MRDSINASNSISEFFKNRNLQIMEEVEKSFDLSLDEKQFIESLKIKFSLPILEAEDTVGKIELVNNNR